MQIVRNAEGRAHYTGLLKCGSVWECPTCQAAVKTARAEEVKKAVEAHGIGRIVMLTLTVAHGLGDDVKALRAGVAKAWQRFCSGAPWLRFKARIGLVGTIRALEVTHGCNGFHPHLHVFVFSELESDAPEWEELEAWCAERWIAKVEGVLGVEHAPSFEHGAKITPARESNYIQKLGLELSDPGTKSARPGHRMPLDIAGSAAAGVARDVNLWRTYAQGFFRARCLTWSKGFRKLFGLDDRTDEEIAEKDELGELVISIEPKVWDTLRDKRFPRDYPNFPGPKGPVTLRRELVTVGLLELAELGAEGAAAVEHALAPYAIVTMREQRAKPPLPREGDRAGPWSLPSLQRAEFQEPPELVRDLEWEYDNHAALERLRELMGRLLGGRR